MPGNRDPTRPAARVARKVLLILNGSWHFDRAPADARLAATRSAIFMRGVAAAVQQQAVEQKGAATVASGIIDCWEFDFTGRREFHGNILRKSPSRVIFAVALVDLSDSVVSGAR